MNTLLILSLGVVVLVLYAAITTLLVRTYISTRNAGFLWLCGAGVVWPLLALLPTFSQLVVVERIGTLMAGQLGSASLTVGELMVMLTYAQRVIGLVLLLFASIYLCRLNRSPDVKAA
jgi:hypothetical protein